MFDLLRFIAEILAKSFSSEALQEAKKTKKLAEVGTELFLLYTALNNILVVGRSILRELENGLAWMERKADGGEPDRELHTHLNFLFYEQGLNIQRFVRSLRRLRTETQVIAPEAYTKLVPLMTGKMNAVYTLLDLMSGQAPKLVYIEPSKMQVLTDAPHTLQDRLAHGYGQDIFIDVGIKNLSSIPARQHTVIKEFLAARRPAQALEEIAAAAEILRDGLEANFSLKDIMLVVGDERCGGDEPFL